MPVFSEISLSLFYAAVFLFLIFRLNFFSNIGLSKKLLAGIFIIKILSGIILSLIYEYYYKDRTNSDIFKFFDDAKNVIYKLLFIHPIDYLRIVTGIDSGAKHLIPVYDKMMCWYKGFNYNLYNENRTIIRLNAVVMIFSFGHYTVHTIFMSFFSFTGLTAIFKVFKKFFINREYELMIAVFFMPSVMIWTSCMLKEGLIISGTGLLIYCYDKIIFGKNYSKRYFLILIVSSIILSVTKIYFLFAVIPGLISLYWSKLDNNKFLIKFIIVYGFFFILVCNSQLFLKNYDCISILSRKQHDFVNFVNSLPHVGSRMNIIELRPTALSLVMTSPVAFFNSFMRPSIFDIYSALVALAAFENLVILIIFAGALIFRNDLKMINVPYFYFCLFFMIIIYTLSGLTTPVFGALVRYKAPALPFLMIILVYLINFKKFYLSLNKLISKFKIGKMVIHHDDNNY